jgi:cell shape-determining protein MreD
MRWPRFAVLVLIITLLQAGWVDLIAVTRLNVTPDLLLIAMVFFAIHCNTYEAIISSFALGLAADVASTGFSMGPWLISLGVFGTGLAYLNRVISIRKKSYEAIAIFLAGLGTGGLAHLLAFFAGRSAGWGGFETLAGTAIYSAVIGPFLFLLFNWLMNIRSRRRGKN